VGLCEAGVSECPGECRQRIFGQDDDLVSLREVSLRQRSGFVHNPTAKVGDSVSAAELVDRGAAAAERLGDLNIVEKFVGRGQDGGHHGVSTQVTVRSERFEKLLGRHDRVATARVRADGTDVDESPESLMSG